MKLSTRMALAMIALVLLTAIAVGGLSYRNVTEAVLPRAMERVAVHVRVLATSLSSYVRGAREDIAGFAAAAAIDGIVRASSAGGVDPQDGITETAWRQRMSKRFVAELTAKPEYRTFRIIGFKSGRELVSVDRRGQGGAIRIVPDDKLQNKADREYLKAAFAAPANSIFVAPIALTTHRTDANRAPVLRVGALIRNSDQTPFGMVFVNVDLKPIFRELAASAQPGGEIYVVDASGDYLVNPDRALEFGSVYGKPTLWQTDFPQLVPAFKSDQPAVRLMTDREGNKVVSGISSAILASGPRVAVIEVTPQSVVLAPIAGVAQSTLLVCLASILCAGGLAIWLARSLTRPLTQMTRAVQAFPESGSVALPSGMSGETGVLAGAFARMMSEVKDKTVSFEKEAAQHRREASERIRLTGVLNNTITNMQDAVLVADEHANILLANPAAFEVMGITAGMNIAEWSDSHDVFLPGGVTSLPVERRPLLQAVRGERIENSDIIVRRKNSQKSVSLLVNGGPIQRGDSEYKGAVVVYRDVTRLVEAERQLRQAQKMEAVGQLTGGVAHDFNNILTVITGTIEILAEGVSERPDLCAIVSMIDEAAKRGSELTSRLLAFSRKQALEPRETDVNELVVNAGRLLRPTLGEQIEVESALADDAWSAFVDPSQLTTALLNLALNARDAMPHGGKLIIETANVVLDESYAGMNAEVRPGEYLMIAVHDGGTGIPAALLDKVFEPFFTTKDVGKGTGLGLSMVYGFIKQTGGHIKIYSEMEHGTTVKMYLPRAVGAAHDASPPVAPVIHGGIESILVVEDDALVRNYVLAQLKSLGYATVSAVNATEALSILDSRANIDLLFTDVVMPGAINGRQLADEARKRRPELKVLFTSGYTENAIVHHGRLDPGVLLLAKPYRRSDLARMIRAALEGTTPSTALGAARTSAAA